MMDNYDDDKKNRLNDESKPRFSEENQSFSYRDRAPRENREGREFRDRAPRESREGREFRDRAPRENREGREFRDRAPRENREGREFRDRAPRENHEGHEFRDRAPRGEVRRPPLRETIMNMDKDILKLLARRCNILDKMKAKFGHLDSREEKTLRTSWEKQAAQMTRDPRVIQQLFALFQEIEFSAKPQAGDEKRVAFNLAPTKEAMNFSMVAPLVSRRCRLYLSLAASAGKALILRPALLSDGEIECIKMFNQCATSLAWDDDGTLRAREGGGLSLPDKVIYVGDDALNFYLLLGYYIGNITRAKFTGETNLKLADFTPLRRFLPQLGARLSNAIPGTTGFPLKLECSGVLPDLIEIPNDIDADAVLGLVLASLSWEKAVSFNLQYHPQAEAIIEEALSILVTCDGKVTKDGQKLHVKPGELCTPKEPLLGMEMSLAAYLLALCFINGGEVKLEGIWPKCDIANHILDVFTQAGMVITVNAKDITARHDILEDTPAEDAVNILHEKLNINPSLAQDARFFPLVLALALSPALRGEKAFLPNIFHELLHDDAKDFLAHFGFEVNDEGEFTPMAHFEADNELAYTANSPYWAMAYALCAFAKPHIKLVNPGILTTLYPKFWNLYNALPCPDIKKHAQELVDEKPVRRRIIAADQAGIGSGDNLD